MQKSEYSVTFNVPGFLGNAEQQSAWRTSPFKALIQHWWRIAVASEEGHDWQRIREKEGRLFGHAWLKDDKGKEWAMRSQVWIRLAQCKSGSLKTWNNDAPKIKHPEVKFQVGSQLYLGYGPLDYRQGLKFPPAINAAEENQLILMHPEQEQAVFNQVMQLIHWFGTLGGRSRNGWGSIALANPGLADYSMLLNGRAELGKVQRPFEICLKEEWPHAIGSDGKGVLVWNTKAFSSWQEVIKKLAETKIGFRTNLSVTKPFDERHILALPVTHHDPNGLKNDRIANQIRFKVIHHQGQYYGLIFHIPCKMPDQITSNLTHPASQNVLPHQLAIWKKVHAYLDEQLARTGSR